MRNEEETNAVFDQLAELAPTETERPMPARAMLSRIKRELDQPAEAKGLSAFWATLWQALFAPARRGAVTAVFTLLLVAVSFTSPAMRAFASDFLGNFRVQKFAAISISPDQIAIFEQIAESGLMPGTLEFIDDPGEGTAVDTLREATRLSGIDHIQTLPQLGNPDGIFVTDGGSARFTLDLESSRAIFELVGLEPTLLPDELRDSNVRIFIFGTIGQRWDDGTMLVQTESPIVEYPNGIDPAILGEALLQLLGLSQGEASRLAQQIDWTSTLVLPIPTDVGTFQEVTVQGVSGLFVETVDGQESALVWQKDGTLYMLTTPAELPALLDLANNLE